MRLVIATLAFCLCLIACRPTVSKTADIKEPSSPPSISEVSPTQAQTEVSKAYVQFIDVRTAEEYASGHAERARNMPLDTLSSKLDLLNKDEPVYIICQTGNRSKKAAELMKDAGFKKLFNVTGGTVAWKEAGLPIK